MVVLLSLIVLMVWLLPALGFAQGAGTTTELAWWVQAIIAVAGVLGTVVLNLLRKYFGQLMDLAAQKTKLAFLAQVDDVVMNKVSELWQTEVKVLKAAASDGKLTPLEKARMKKKAVDWANDLLDVKQLLGIFGDHVNAALGNVVDANVVTAKNLARVPKLETPLLP